MKRGFNILQISILSLFFGLLMIFSCTKENSQSTEQEENASKVSSEADGEAEIIFNGTFDDVFGVNTEVGLGGVGGIFGRTVAGGFDDDPNTQRPNVCPVVTVTRPTPNPFPVHVVIDFGNAGCIGRDGHFRRGKIIIDYTNRITHPGAVAETTFDGFYFDSIHVEGLHRVKNTGSVLPLARSFEVDVINARLTRPNGDYTQWNSHKEIVQIEGLATLDFPLDDVFRITGASHGDVRRGALLVRWESTIREPLIKRFNCRWIVKGVIRTVRGPNSNNPWVAELDFSYPNAGACDNLARININGRLHIITLP